MKYICKIFSILLFFNFFLFQKSIAQGPRFVIWLTSPTTRLLLGILLCICILLFCVLWITFKRHTNSSGFRDIETLIDTGHYENILSQYGSKVRENTSLMEKLALAYIRADKITQEAMDIYESVLKSNPDFKEVIYQLSRAYAVMGKEDDRSLNLYKKAVNLGNSDPVVLQITADLLYKRNQWESAATIYTQLVTRGNTSPDISIRLAHCFLRLQRQDEYALEIYASALSASPQEKTLLLALARFYSERNLFDSHACMVYEQALQIKPDIITIRLALGQAYLSQRKLTQCIEHCKYLINRGIMDNDVVRLLAGVYVETEQWDESASLYQKLLALDPEEPEYQIGLARAYAGLKRKDEEAINVYQKALKLNNELVPAWEQLFQIYLQQQNLESILESAEKLLELSQDCWKKIIPDIEKLALRYPSELRIPLLLGNAYICSNQTDYAISSFDRVLEISSDEEIIQKLIYGFTYILQHAPISREARMRRAKLYVMMNQLMDAIRDFEWIHENEGSVPEVTRSLMALYQSLIQSDDNVSPSVHYNLGRLYEEDASWQDAILEYQQSAKAREFEQDSGVGMARCFYKMEKLDIAFEQASRLNMTDHVKDLLYTIAQSYRQTQQFDKAMEILDKIYTADSKYKDVGLMIHDTQMRAEEQKMDKTALQKQEKLSPKIRYKIIEEIARGGMGIVYCAMDIVLNEMVALKKLPHDLADDPQILERFLREVKSTRKLNHRNIVRVYDIVEEEGNRFISMEYVVGRNLRSILREKSKLSEPETVNIIRQICMALQDAHDQGIVHRDIKPANVMIDSTGLVKVMDFGIAKVKGEQKLTQTTDFLGTPVYMSPEQTQGLQTDHRSDIYSTGILMYELLTGEVPFSKGNIGYQHIHVVPPPPDHITPSLQKIVMKSIEKKPEDRYPSAEDMIEDLDKVYPHSKKRN